MWRRLAPQVLGAVVRRYGDFEGAEDAVQEALLAAAVKWPVDGEPDDPRAWLITVASRRLIDQHRADRARARREVTVASMAPIDELVAPPADTGDPGDDTLTVLALCCHPALSPPSQIALTLRAVGGLTTAQVARAFLVPEATMAQRISRAKQAIRDAGGRFDTPPDEARMRAVRHVLYLIFNEGYTPSGDESMAAEAIRLTRAAFTLRPDDGEIAGLLALMLLTDARRAARTGADGEIVPLAEQDRSLWDRARIAEGVALITSTLAGRPVGPYQVQAAVAALHAEAPTAADTDWPQIAALYELLDGLAPNPVVTLNRAVATAMVHGSGAGLELLSALDADPRMAKHHRLHAVRAHLREMAGDTAGARESYRLAARLATSEPERRYLTERAARLPGG